MQRMWFEPRRRTVVLVRRALAVACARALAREACDLLLDVRVQALKVRRAHAVRYVFAGPWPVCAIERVARLAAVGRRHHANLEGR